MQYSVSCKTNDNENDDDDNDNDKDNDSNNIDDNDNDNDNNNAHDNDNDNDNDNDDDDVQDRLADRLCTENGTWWVHPDSNRWLGQEWQDISGHMIGQMDILTLIVWLEY